MYAQRRFRSACAFAQSDQNLRWAHFGQPRMQRFFPCGQRRLIKLRGSKDFFSRCSDSNVYSKRLKTCSRAGNSARMLRISCFMVFINTGISTRYLILWKILLLNQQLLVWMHFILEKKERRRTRLVLLLLLSLLLLLLFPQQHITWHSLSFLFIPPNFKENIAFWSFVRPSVRLFVTLLSKIHVSR